MQVLATFLSSSPVSIFDIRLRGQNGWPASQRIAMFQRREAEERRPGAFPALSSCTTCSLPSCPQSKQQCFATAYCILLVSHSDISLVATRLHSISKPPVPPVMSTAPVSSGHQHGGDSGDFVMLEDHKHNSEPFTLDVLGVS